MRKRAVVLILVVAALLSFPPSSAAQWVQTGGRVFISRNGGAARKTAKSGLTTMGISSLSVVETDLYAGVGSRVLLSRDEGATWMELGSAIPSDFVHGVAAEGPNLFAWSGEPTGFQDRLVARSTDKGVAWKPIDSGLKSQGVLEVDCLVVKEQNLFAGTWGGGILEGGVYVTADNGASWTPLNSGLPPQTHVWCIVASGTNLLVGTSNGGAWRLPLSDITNSKR